MNFLEKQFRLKYNRYPTLREALLLTKNPKHEYQFENISVDCNLQSYDYRTFKIMSTTTAPILQHWKNGNICDNSIMEIFDALSYIKTPIYMILTHISYPMGGGESFMYQTMEWMNEIGYQCIWVSYANGKTGIYEKDEIIDYPFGSMHHMKGGITDENIKLAIDKYHPDVVHTQGMANVKSHKILFNHRIHQMAGFHFWTGLIELNNETFNKDIIMNSQKHKVDYSYITMGKHDVYMYVVSEYMQEVQKAMKTGHIGTIFYPVPPKHHYEVDKYNVNRLYVTLINICDGKGGEIIKECIRELPHIPFLCVETEPGHDELYKEIEELCQRDNCKYLRYGDVKEVYKETRILLAPNQVDETFGRVVFEAASNGIPIITTGRGFLSTMLGNSAIYLNDEIENWIRTIDKLYDDTEYLYDLSEKIKKEVSKIVSPRMPMTEDLLNMTISSNKNNIMFYCPWGDQGLGIQCRHYVNLLRSLNFRCYIFSFHPYLCRGKKFKLQKDQSEWLTADHIHYSLNNREDVTNNEIEEFIRILRIGTFIMPEVCWKPNWDRLSYIKSLNVKTIIIPNIETVRSDEIPLHQNVDIVMANTKICQNKLEERGITNVKYIGHGITFPTYTSKLPLSEDNKIMFVHIAGIDAIDRKQTDKVLEAFVQACEKRDNIHLTVTFAERIPPEIVHYQGHPQITILFGDLSYQTIITLYQENHVSIQPSSHEGLGLNFYESIASGTPVITLNHPPHNEVIINGETGWLIDCESIALTDNNQGVVDKARFNLQDLVDIIVKLDVSQIKKMIKNTYSSYENKWTDEKFLIRFLRAFY